MCFSELLQILGFGKSEASADVFSSTCREEENDTTGSSRQFPWAHPKSCQRSGQRFLLPPLVFLPLKDSELGRRWLCIESLAARRRNPLIPVYFVLLHIWFILHSKVPLLVLWSFLPLPFFFFFTSCFCLIDWRLNPVWPLTTHYIVEKDLEILVLLPPIPVCWDHNHASSYLVYY